MGGGGELERGSAADTGGGRREWTGGAGGDGPAGVDRRAGWTGGGSVDQRQGGGEGWGGGGGRGHRATTVRGCPSHTRGWRGAGTWGRGVRAVSSRVWRARGGGPCPWDTPRSWREAPPAAGVLGAGGGPVVGRSCQVMLLTSFLRNLLLLSRPSESGVGGPVDGPSSRVRAWTEMQLAEAEIILAQTIDMADMSKVCILKEKKHEESTRFTKGSPF